MDGSIFSSQLKKLALRAVYLSLTCLIWHGTAYGQQADNDLDGLSNAQEVAIGTDPNDVDTDNDFLQTATKSLRVLILCNQIATTTV